MDTHMQIGLVVHMTRGLPADICFLLRVLLLLRVARSNLKLLYLVSRQSIKGAVMAACEVAWLCKLLVDMCVAIPHKIVTYCDNISSIQLAQSHCSMHKLSILRSTTTSFGSMF